jgi:hypothetical protein
MEKIAMKKPKTMADLLTVVDMCIEASEAWAQLLETRGKRTSRKKEDHEVNTVDRVRSQVSRGPRIPWQAIFGAEREETFSVSR